MLYGQYRADRQKLDCTLKQIKMDIYKDIKRYLHYLLYATKSQLKTEVANSYLNWLWWILEPLMDMVVYTVVFGWFFKSQIECFPAFVFIGITIWGFFSKSLNQSTKLIKNNAAIVSKVYIPKHILLIKNLAVNGFKMLISFGVTAVIFLIYRIPVNVCLLYVIPVIVELFLLTYGIGCFFMHFGVYVDDLAYIVSILLNLMMFASGIFYSIEEKAPEPVNQILLYCNPVAFMIQSMRNATMYRLGIHKPVLLVWLLISGVLAALGTRLIYKNENSYVKVI